MWELVIEEKGHWGCMTVLILRMVLAGSRMPGICACVLIHC